MDRFLSLNTVRSVRKINFQWGSVSEVSRLNAWLTDFGDRDAEKVNLNLNVDESYSPIYSLPDTFFIQNNLVKLKLTTVVLKVPQLVCFPKLKEMTLDSVKLLDETSMKNLLCGSPLLKTLEMYHGDNVQKLHICSTSLRNLILHMEYYNLDVVIDSPNLTFLSLRDYGSSTFTIINASLLASAYLYILDGERLLKLLIQISHVKELEFYQCFMNDLLDRSLANLPMLHSLIHLAVVSKMEDDGRTLSRLLYCTPKLVTLALKKTSDGRLADPFAWYEPREVHQCLLSSIERVKLEGFGDGDQDIQMITYILKNAMVLKKLSIICHSQNLVHETKFLTTLLTLPRSSITCQVEYKLH